MSPFLIGEFDFANNKKYTYTVKCEFENSQDRLYKKSYSINRKLVYIDEYLHVFMCIYELCNCILT